MKPVLKSNLSFSRIIRNIYSPVVFFVVLYALFNNLFLFAILNPATYLSNGVSFSKFLKDYIDSSLYYIYPIVLISATFAMLLLAAFRLYRRNGALTSIFIFTILLSAYPAIMLFNGKADKLDFRKYKVFKSIESDILGGMKLKDGAITTLNNYSIYVEDMFDTHHYQNAFLNRVGVNEPLYIADRLAVEVNTIQLRGLIIIENGDEILKTTEGVNIKFGDDIKDTLYKSMSGFHMLEPINIVIYKFMNSGNTLYSFILFFSSLFLFFLSSYLVIASLSSPMHTLHNVLIVILTYYIFVVAFYFISRTFHVVSIIESYSILKICLFVLAYDIVAIILAIILKSVFHFNKYYSDERS